MTFVMFSFSALFLLIATHPFITYPLTLWIVRLYKRRHMFFSLRTGKESFAVCVCAYNEEAVIEQKARNLIALKKIFPDIEILVYVDASADNTAAILDRYKNEIDVHVSPFRYGKTHGMNLLISKAKASIVIFTDANVIMDIESMRALPGYFADPKVGCVCGHLQYVNANETTTAKTGSLYWRLEEFIKSLENDTGSVMGADGSIFAIRRSLHTPPPDDIIDDMFVSFSILCDGHLIVRAPEIVAYEKSAVSAHEEFRRKIRIACQAFNVHRLLWPRLRKLGALDLYKYISHKLMRWFIIYWLVLAAICFEIAMIMAGIGIVGIVIMASGLLILCAGYFGRLSIISQVSDILGAFIATGFGVWRSILGEHFQTWSPASSARNI